jgi:hypothetical protein
LEKHLIKLSTIQRSPKRYLIMATFLILCACGQAHSEKDGTIARKSYAEPVSLAIEGYNYTNRHIDTFTVDGQGGGNLYVSSPTSGGGGTVCCISYRPGTTVNTVTVRWQSGACYYHVRSSTSDDVYDRYHLFYKEQEVTVSDEIPLEAKYMEIHFYPDGSVKAAVTDHASPPRFSLSKERQEKSKYPRCPNDKKPQ